MPADGHRTERDATSTLLPGEPALAGTPVVVRRHASVSAVVGLAGSAMAIAYLWRAAQTMSVLDWTLCAVMAVVATVHLAWLVDARTPLLVADELGVRIRLGHEWRGLPWEAVAQVVVHPRRGLLRDGRLVFAPRSLARALEGLEPRARRHVGWNQRLYGAPLAVPLGLTTQTSEGSGDLTLAGRLAVLALDRTDVVEVEPRAAEAMPVPDTTTATEAGPEEASPPVEEADRGVLPPRDAEHVPLSRTSSPLPSHPVRRSILGGIGTIVSRVAKGREHDVDVVPADDGAADEPAGTPDSPHELPVSPAVAVRDAAPLRETRPGLRAQITRDLPSGRSMGANALHEPTGHGLDRSLPEGRELRRPGSVDLVFEQAGGGQVRPISTLGDPVEPLVIDDYVTEPAYDPVIGPELAASRNRLGLSVDGLAERTRIRPHVIESIEVDDFAPCGGDFYARGHLRTLARILGVDVKPLLERFDERYATAPVNARRVFEAELSTGMTGSMRSTVGGPSWGLLVGVVLALVLVWGVVRLATGVPPEEVELPAPVVGAPSVVERGPVPGAGTAPVKEPLSVRLTAAEGDTQVVVRDGNGRVVFTGELVLGERRTVRATPPVRVRAADGGVVEVAVNGRDRGFLGTLGEPARRTFG